MLIDENTTRADLELAAVEAGFCNTTAGCDEVAAMGDEALRSKIIVWIEAGDECA